ncbi:MAG: hypothetical protein J3Q66DRAFT_344099 [Benniella sp.]|nr:MAG: hypothetical protein J3Q66DRAFT_344099 [Benniella sp.]
MSFFLMEPIMNRYASGRLDQMRLQIQKKAMRSSSVTKSSAQDSTATSTAVQTSINVAIPSSTGTTLAMSASTTASRSVVSSTTPGQRGVLLRTRSSSFTVRKTDLIEQQDLYCKSPSAMAPAAMVVYQNMHEESEIQESKRLLSEEKNVEGTMLFTGHQDTPDGPHTSVMMGEEEEEDQDDSDETSLFMQLLLIRLFPLTPYWFINLASPLVGVPVVPFMTSMLLGCMPYNYICAQAGAILSEIHELRDIYQQPWILFQIVVVLLLSTAAVLISKRAKKQQKEQQCKSRSSEDERDTTNDETTHRLLGSTLEHHRHSREEPRDSISMSSLNSHQDSAVIDMSTYRY